jgi:hypothetical protein
LADQAKARRLSNHAGLWLFGLSSGCKSTRLLGSS